MAFGLNVTRTSRELAFTELPGVTHEWVFLGGSLSVLRDLIVRVSGEPLDHGIGYRFSVLFFYMKFVSSASSQITYLSNIAHIPPYTNLVKWTHHAQLIIYGYNNLCVAQMGLAQKSVATSHQSDYPGRLLLQCIVSFCRPLKDVPIRTKSPLNLPFNFYS